MDIDGNPLPGLDASAGQDMMRNWLSCGSPVVEKSQAPSNGQMPGDTCTSGEVGDCRVSNETDPPQPTWTWLYENYFSTLECTACHETGGASQGTMILGTTSTMAYSAMVDAQTAADAMCSGQTIVVPGDADASNLVHKLEGQLPDGGAICGNRMPFGGRAPNAAVLQAVRDWIDAGAMNN